MGRWESEKTIQDGSSRDSRMNEKGDCLMNIS